MKRAPIVVASTAAGLVAVLAFHSHPPSGGLLRATGLTTAGPTTAGPTTTAPATVGPTPSTSPASTGTVRSATGALTPYPYGELSVKVTASGSRITAASIASVRVADSLSASINSQAGPYLDRQVLQAQSANINGVSGATYTSEAYAQSLQTALDHLGIK